jgi:hypothetical protein
MDDLFRDFLVWAIGFVCVSAALLIVTHVVANKWRERRRNRQTQAG